MAMPEPARIETHQVVLDAHASRSLATSILIAGQLLEHHDIDPDQHPAILKALARAAMALAHDVMAAEPRPASHPESARSVA